jgi:hypothetical protein
MRIAPGIAFFLLGLAFQFLSLQAHGQVFTTSPDSVLVLTPEADTVAQEKQFFLSGLKNLDRPGRAAVFSAVLPGLGQVYNGAWWKVPIIYATGGVIGYFIVDNHRNYKDFELALEQRLDPNATDNYVDHRYYGVDWPAGTRNLGLSRDYHRRFRDMSIIIGVIAYTMNIAEAYVHGHMREFDVGENLSLRVQPDMFRTPAANTLTPGLTLTLYTRTK